MTKIVALDAGHYTKTAGKRSPDGSLFEYEFNWDIVLKIRAHLTRCGIKVIMTRDCVDKERTLQQRVTTANNANADIFVSCHSNAAGSGDWNSASGWEIFCYKLGTSAASLAGKIQDNIFPDFKTKYNMKNRGVKVSDFYVLMKTKMHAVLIESGFFTNKEEVELIKKQSFRRDLAKSISKGICEYLSVSWVEDSYPESYLDYIATGTNNTVWANIYTSNSIESKVLSVLNKGAYVEVTKELPNGWVRVNYGSSYGYMLKDDLSISYLQTPTIENDWRDTLVDELLTKEIINKEDYEIIKDDEPTMRVLHILHKNEVL